MTAITDHQLAVLATVSETGTAVFNCSVSGQPTLGVEWFRQLPNGTLDPIST